MNRNDRNSKKYDDNKRTNKKRRYDSKDKKSTYAKELDQQEKEQNYNNRPSMYFKDKALAEQVSSFSMNQFLEADSKPFADGQFKNVSVPAILTMYFNPSPGYTRGTSTAEGGINIAAMKAYTKLSSMNAKTTQYAPQDVATLLLALGEVVAISETIRRAFRIIFLYNKRNWNYPKEVLAAMGLNVDDFIAKIADYRLEFNAIINMINQISFPGDIEWFDKCKQMYSHLYTDSESPMAQTYLFMPATTWTIDEESYDEGTILKTTAFGLNLDGTGRFSVTMGSWLSTLKTMIQRILNSATFNYIYADVLRLVNPSRLMVMPYLTEGETISPEYDPMILLQLDNANFVQMPDGVLAENQTPDNDVYPKIDNNAVFYAPHIVHNRGLGLTLDRAIINFPHSMGNPDVDQRIESTRMISLAEGDETATEKAALADHYPVSLRIVHGLYDGVIANLLAASDAGGLSIYVAQEIADLNKFDHCPRMTIVDRTTHDLTYLIGDLDFFTDISLDYLQKVNDLAYVTLFEVEIS